MSTFTIVVLILAILVVLIALAIWLFLRSLRRRSSSARHRSGPRTVAELVEMRGVEGQDVPAAVVAPAAEPAAAEPVEEAAEQVEEPVAESADSASEGAGAEAPADAADDAAPRPSLSSAGGADTPWARGARMTGDATDGAAKAWADIDPPAAPAADESAPGRSWVPAVIAGGVGAAGLAAVAAHGRPGDAAEEAGDPAVRAQPESDEAPSEPDDGVTESAEEPVAAEPVVAEASDDADAAEEPVAEEPVSDVPAAEEPMTEEPVAEAQAAASEGPPATDDTWLPDDDADDSAVDAGENVAPEAQPSVEGFGAGAQAPAAEDRGGAPGWLAGAAAGAVGAAGLAAVGAHRSGDEESQDADQPVSEADPADPTDPALEGTVADGEEPASVAAENSDSAEEVADVVDDDAAPAADVAQAEVPAADAPAGGWADVPVVDEGVDSGEPEDGPPAAEEPHGGGPGVAAAAAGAAAVGGLAVAGLAGRDDSSQSAHPEVAADVVAVDEESDPADAVADVVDDDAAAEADVAAVEVPADDEGIDASDPVDGSSPADEDPSGGGVGLAAGAAVVGGLAVAGLAGRDDSPPADGPDDVSVVDEDVDETDHGAVAAEDVESAESADAPAVDDVTAEVEAPAVDEEADGAGLAVVAGAAAGGGLAVAGPAGRGERAETVDPAEDDPSVAGAEWLSGTTDDDDGLTDEEREEQLGEGGAADPTGPTGADLAAVHSETAEAEDRRPRRTPAEVAAEHAAVDVALLRTFGVAEAGDRPGSAPIVSLSAAGTHAGPRAAEGPTVPVTVRVLGSDDEPVAGASTALVDDRGAQVVTAVTGEDGSAELAAPARATYMVVASAERHQPGAVAVAVGDGPAEAAVPLVRSSSVAGSVWGADEAISGARVALLQDGEIVEETESGGDGGFRIPDLTAGRYALSVTAPEHEKRVAPLEVPVATDVRQDVDLEPSALVGTSPQAPSGH